MPRFNLTKNAERDLINILIYGIENFGASKANEYHVKMINCFELIASNQEIGRRADFIDSNIRRHEFISHIIFYEIVENSILILAIIHKSRLINIKELFAQ